VLVVLPAVLLLAERRAAPRATPLRRSRVPSPAGR
jgi:hypothetical protein